MKQFWLIRHAKSANSAPNPEQGDFYRDLNERGRRDGAHMQTWFAQTANNQPACRPDWLITSNAVRAQSTSEFVASGFSIGADQRISDASIYNAGPESLLDALCSTPADANCVALVAHNPGLTWLVNALSDPAETIDNLPTLGCALFQTDIDDWATITKTRRLLLVSPGVVVKT